MHICKNVHQCENSKIYIKFNFNIYKYIIPIIHIFIAEIDKSNVEDTMIYRSATKNLKSKHQVKFSVKIC